MKELPVTSEATLFYRASRKNQDDDVIAQLDRGFDPPKINLDLNFIKDYYRNNDLGQRDMDLMIEELREINVLGESCLEYLC
jgi:hypothetical protein